MSALEHSQVRLCNISSVDMATCVPCCMGGLGNIAVSGRLRLTLSCFHIKKILHTKMAVRMGSSLTAPGSAAVAPAVSSAGGFKVMLPYRYGGMVNRSGAPAINHIYSLAPACFTQIERSPLWTSPPHTSLPYMHETNQVPPKEILDIVDAPPQPSLSYSPDRTMVRGEAMG